MPAALFYLSSAASVATVRSLVTRSAFVEPISSSATLQQSTAFALVHRTTTTTTASRRGNSFGIGGFQLWNSKQNSNNANEDDNATNEIFYDDFADLIGTDYASQSSVLDVSSSTSSSIANNNNTEDEEDSLPDFDDVDDDDTPKRTNPKDLIAIPLPKLTSPLNDLIGATTRNFSFGPDLLISSYAGSLGFDEVVDWQYYAMDEDSGERTPVGPRPMDPSQPARTRSSSGSVVRLFRGEIVGKLASVLRSRGLDSRVWMKEYSGKDALELARSERRNVGRLQSEWLRGYLENSGRGEDRELLERMRKGEWMDVAQRRYVDGLTDTPTKEDDDHLATLMQILLKEKAPFTSLLGEMNLNDYYDDPDLDPNEWYRSLGVKPPQPGSVWLIYDYHGLSTAASYAVPLLMQRNKLPPKRGPFGGIVQAPPLPPFKERARYMVQGVLKGMLNSLAVAHESGIVHRSLGRSSFILSSVGQDKREATSPYAVVVERLRVILGDWGFSASLEEAVQEKEFIARCRVYGITAVGPDGRVNGAAIEFAKAEDLHALGFVFLAMLFTTLAEPMTLSAQLPPTDDDSWQRLFSEIFEKDMDEFRDYCSNEEVWNSVVELLDKEEGEGWKVLGQLLLARENVANQYNDADENEKDDVVSARGLLSSQFFRMRLI